MTRKKKKERSRYIIFFFMLRTVPVVVLGRGSECERAAMGHGSEDRVTPA